MAEETASQSEEGDESIIFVGEGPLFDAKGNQKIAPFWRNNPTSHPKPLPVTDSMNHQLKHVSPVKRLAAGFELNEKGLFKLDKASVAELTASIVTSLGQKEGDEILHQILKNTEHIRQGQVVYPSISDNPPSTGLRDQVNSVLERLADNCVKDYNNISQTQKSSLQETKGQIVDELTKNLQKELFKLANLIDDSNDSLHSNITSLLSGLTLDKENNRESGASEVKLAHGSLIEKMNMVNASSVDEKLVKGVYETLETLVGQSTTQADLLKGLLEKSANLSLETTKDIQNHLNRLTELEPTETFATVGQNITREVTDSIKREMERIEPVLNGLSVVPDRTEALVGSLQDQMNNHSLHESYVFLSDSVKLEKCIREGAASSLSEAKTFVGPLLETFCSESENYVSRQSYLDAITSYQYTVNQQKAEIEMLKQKLSDAESKHEQIHMQNSAILVGQSQKADQVISLLHKAQIEKENVLTQEVERLAGLVSSKDVQILSEQEKQNGLEQEISRLKSEKQSLSMALTEQSDAEALKQTVNHLSTTRRRYKDGIRNLRVKVEGLRLSVLQARAEKDAILQEIIRLKGDLQRELVINHGDMAGSKRICEPVISGTLMKKRNYADGMSAQGSLERFDKRVFSSPTQFSELSVDGTSNDMKAKSQRITNEKENLY